MKAGVLKDRFGQERRPARVKPVGRLLTCTVCSTPVDVLEAALGARSDREHRWIVPDEYVCGGCLDAVELVGGEQGLGV